MKSSKIDDFQENQLVMVIKAWQRVHLHCKTCFATEVEQVRQDVTVEIVFIVKKDQKNRLFLVCFLRFVENVGMNI